MILHNFISLRAFTVYMDLLRFEISLRSLKNYCNTLQIAKKLDLWYGGKCHKNKFHGSFIDSFYFLEDSCKVMQKKNVFDKRLLFGWLNWICFLLSDLIWQDAISPYLLSRANQGNWPLFEKLKGNYSLKKKKRTLSYSWKIAVC